MTANPLVTIIIPVYNREKIILETLRSAQNQTYNNFEIIIVDNLSTDRTYELLKKETLKDERIKLYRNQKNLGPVKNWKKCIEYSKGEYIKILWSDDQIERTFLEKTIHILNENSEIAFIYTTTKIYSEIDEEITYRYGKTGKYRLEKFVENQLLGGIPVPRSPGNALFRARDIKKNLIVDLKNPKNMDFSKYGAGNDLLLFLLVVEDYEYFYFVDEVLSFFRNHKNSFSVGNDLEEYYYYSKVYFIEKLRNKVNEKIIDKFYTLLSVRRKYNYMVINKRFKFKLFYLFQKIFFKIFKLKG